MAKIIPLNIMLSYPVNWTKYQVLRDILQNFYDDIGNEKFFKLLKIDYISNKNIVLLSIPSKGFNYEWLLHIGASSKQDKSGKFAGLYGEGFKIASLCALRDYNWKITMRSQNWVIEVLSQETIIDGKTLQQLAYNVNEGSNYSKDTLMIIENFSKEDFDLLNDVKLSFFSNDNPLFGKCIFRNAKIALYERSDVQKPSCLPKGLKTDGNGIIFIGYQVRGAINLSLVICHHIFKLDGRDREDVYIGTIIDLLIDMVDYIDAKTSFYLLEKLEKYWYDYPDKKDDVDSWYSLIRKLICKIAYFDSKLKKRFKLNHPDLIVCERPINIMMQNKKTQALVWRKQYLPDSILVQDSFYLFDYDDIVERCEKSGGFNTTRKPDNYEQNLLNILENAAKELFRDYLIYFPEIKIIINDSSVYNGTAHLIKNKNIIYNCNGKRIRYTFENIDIKKASLTENNFFQAFSTYCHELCHCFGGDASNSFSGSLTDILGIIIKNNEIVDKYKRIWLEFFAEKDYSEASHLSP